VKQDIGAGGVGDKFGWTACSHDADVLCDERWWSVSTTENVDDVCNLAIRAGVIVA
jgi:hypothetical protein